MNQSELVSSIQSALQGHLSKTEITAVLGALAHTARSELAAGNEVALTGLGRLSVKTRAARTGRNPATGETLAIPEKRVPQFSAAGALKEAVA